MMKVLMAYIPVVHQGYLNFFKRYPKANLLVIGPELIAETDHLRKDLRALSPYRIALMIKSLNILGHVGVINRSDLISLVARPNIQLIMPDEDVSRDVAERYLTGQDIIWESIFLRYDRKATQQPHEIEVDRVVKFSGLQGEMLRIAQSTSQQSPDWWRQVGAVLVKDGQVLMTAFNDHTAGQQTAYILGDPRSNFSKGVEIELSLSEHAEQRMISEAARQATISTEGADIYLTTFPCPPCARAVARAGIKRLFFVEGSYSMLDTVQIMHAAGMEIIRVI